MKWDLEILPIFLLLNLISPLPLVYYHVKKNLETIYQKTLPKLAVTALCLHYRDGN